MKILLIIWLAIFISTTLFGNVKINGVRTNNIVTKAYAVLIAATILTFILGLPFLGILKLLGI